MIINKILYCQEMLATHSFPSSIFIGKNNRSSNCDQRQSKYPVDNDRVLKKSIGKNKTKKRRYMRNSNCYLFSFRYRYPGFWTADRVSESLIRCRKISPGFGMDIFPPAVLKKFAERIFFFSQHLINLRYGYFSFRSA